MVRIWGPHVEKWLAQVRLDHLQGTSRKSAPKKHTPLGEFDEQPSDTLW